MFKHTKKSIIAIGLVAMAVSAQNQNARVKGLGGSDVVTDISRIATYNPVYVNDYKNQIQATWDAPIIGTKSLGDVVTVGAVLNNGLILSSFYTDAAPLPRIGAATAPQYSPHVIVGLDFAPVKIGIEGFLEWAWQTDHTESNPTGTALTATNNSSRISHPGFAIGAEFGADMLSIALVGGIGFPTIKGSNEVTAPDGAKTLSTTQSESGLSAKAGGEFGIPVNAAKFTFGAQWSLVNYQFSATTAGTTTNTNKTTINTVSPYIAVQTEILDKVLLIAQEKTDIAMSKVEPVHTQGNRYNLNTDILSTISSGLEKQFASVWIFDSVGTRGGLSWSFATGFSHNVDEGTTVANSINNTDAKDPVVFGPAVPYIGLGATRGAVTADLYLNPTGWNNTGLIAGPPVAKFTLSLKF